MSWLLLALQGILSAVLLVAATEKTLRAEEFFAALRFSHLPAGSIAPIGVAVPALELRDLDVVYRVRGRDRQVLRGVSLEVGRGESYGLVGESGCGKSTALRVIGDLLLVQEVAHRRIDPAVGSLDVQTARLQHGRKLLVRQPFPVAPVARLQVTFLERRLDQADGRDRALVVGLARVLEISVQLLAQHGGYRRQLLVGEVQRGVRAEGEGAGAGRRGAPAGSDRGDPRRIAPWPRW